VINLILIRMILPGWNSLDSVKRIGDAVQTGTLCCWGCLVLFEIVAHLWERRKSLFTTLAFIAFGLAVVGEVGNYKYGGRREQLHDEAEKVLRKTADDAQRDATTAKGQAVATQGALDQLKNQMKWRELTKTQRSLLIAKLSPFKGTALMMIYIGTGGEETRRYAEEIAEAIRAAGWTVGMNEGMHRGEARYGVTVVVNDKLHPHPATVLLDTLKKAGVVDVEGDGNPNLSKDDFQLIVRPKPPVQATRVQ
jgi:hypothetical protein